MAQNLETGMRPAFIAFIAACLPLGAYAHGGWTPQVDAMQASRAEPVIALRTNDAAAEKSGKLAASTPDVPSKDPPLCTSPAVSAWNPAATGDGRICKPTQWAGPKNWRG
jgi:hypothetical protein